MELLLQQFINGLTAGAEYALLAAGLSLIFGVLEIVNFAHGEFYMLGTYMLYVAETQGHLGYVPAALLAILGMGLFGLLFYVFVVRRILNRGWQVQLVATLAVSILLVNTAIVIAGSVPKVVPSPFSEDVLAIGGYPVSVQRFVILGATIIAFVLLFSYLRYTKTGKAMRAVAQNRVAAEVVGIPIQRIGMAAIIAGSALAGVASVTIAPLYTVSPTMGQLVVIKAFAAVVMGGFGNVSGAILSALALGLVEAFGATYIASDYSDLIVFAVMILVLLVRPHGLFGRTVRA
jgi:branched-chain amino acid transport system permease protein